jgi:hypothetical protein
MLYKADITQVFFCVAFHALRVFEIDHDFVHLDNTSFIILNPLKTPRQCGSPMVIPETIVQT